MRSLSIQSTHSVERIEFESFWFVCPCFADVFVGRETLEGFEATTKIVSVYEVGGMAFELLVAVVVVALGGRLFDGSVHAFHRAICPAVFAFDSQGSPYLNGI
jgi:hypothetical protein